MPSVEYERDRLVARTQNAGPTTVLPPFDGSLPKGEQILRAMIDMIQGQRPGTLLPSERVLAEQFGVARMTIRDCINELERRDLVRRSPRRGTFVSEPRLTQSDVFRSFSDDMRLRGMRPGASRILKEVRPASPDVALELGIEEGDPVHFIERVRTADDEPMAIERSNIPFVPFPQLGALMDLGSSLYGVLGEHYGVKLDSAEQRVRVESLSHDDAVEMNQADAEPAFMIERSSRDVTGMVVEFGRSLYRTDRYEIVMHVHRPQ